MEAVWQVIVGEGWKLVAAVVLGGAIGLERELSGKPAGLRTNILIAVGSTLITAMSVHVAGNGAEPGRIPSDPGRIAAQIVTGVGFLGAGSIIQSRASVVGLTTAATIWAVAGIGIAIGAGHLALAGVTTVVILLCLTLLRPLESWTIGRREHAQLQVVLANEKAAEQVVAALARAAISVEHTTLNKTAAGVELSVACVVKPHFTSEFVRTVLELDGVVSVTVST